MLSRVADAIYWMSRYVERAENVARFLEVTLNLLLDSPRESEASHWQALIATSGDEDLFAERYQEATRADVIRFLTADKQYSNSILSSLAAARENARSVREVISRDMWLALNEFYLMVKSTEIDPDDLEGLAGFYQRVRQAGLLFEGTTNATWSHREPWHFAQLGRMMERADKTSRILDVKYFILLPSTTYVGSAYDQLQWSALLHSASATQMFRQVHHETNPRNVADFLIFNPWFPRSIRFGVTRATESLRAIQGSRNGATPRAGERVLGQLQAKLDYGVIDDVLNIGMHEYLDQIQTDLNNAATAITEQFVLEPSQA